MDGSLKFRKVHVGAFVWEVDSGPPSHFKILVQMRAKSKRSEGHTLRQGRHDNKNGPSNWM